MCANKFKIDHHKMAKINVSSCYIMLVKLIYIKIGNSAKYESETRSQEIQSL